ncbi:MAG: ketoacyl-ACP synthase III [Anaeromyxobacteraceae bacterium]
MNLAFRGRKIAGLLTVLPANERTFVEEMSNFNFPVARSMKLKEVMGYDRHRLVDGPVCASDLAVHGLEHLFASGRLGRDDFDALVVVTQSPDFLMPPTSSVIQGRLGLKHDLFCLDINQGCAGFLIGLMQGFLLLDQPTISRVVLVNVDVLSRKVSTKDRNSYPLIGDAASIAVLERSEDPGIIHANLKMDGTRAQALTIPAGGFRLPSSPETAVMEEDAEGNLRAKDHLRMDGSAVFNFVQVEVPPMIDALLATAGVTHAEVDAYLFHQPNRFMLQKLADKMKVPHEKMPSNIVEHFGNSSGVTIPLAIVFNLREKLLSDSIRACLAGFGVGLTWSSMLLRLGPMNFCDMIDFEGGSVRAGVS